MSERIPVQIVEIAEPSTFKKKAASSDRQEQPRNKAGKRRIDTDRVQMNSSAPGRLAHMNESAMLNQNALLGCLERLQRRHQVTQPVDLVVIQRTALQPLHILGQLLHRAALEHRPQRHVQL